MNPAIVRAILWKDVTCLLPMASLVTLLFFGDAVVTRLELLPIWTEYGLIVMQVAMLVLVLSVFQLDSPASLTDDWLCRPVRIRELLAAKFALLTGSLYLSRAAGTLAADLGLGFPWQEALQDAFLLPDTALPFLLLIFLFTAIVTRTLAEGFGVVFAIFVAIFVLPTPFVRPPGPLSPGIREAIPLSGLGWLASAPAGVVCALLVVAGFWLVYARRRLRQARVLFAVTVAITLLLAISPMMLLPWHVSYSVQKTLVPRDQNVAVTMRGTRQCFPATVRARLTEPAFESARRAAGLDLWEEEALRDLGANSVAFVTSFEPRGLPQYWRVALNYVQATYEVRSETLYSLRPARYFTSEASGAISHAWMLPEPGVTRLAQSPDAKLLMTYSLTLLEPVEHRLRVDGRRYRLPGLGHCSARLNESANRIDVDCFSGFSRPAQISAELDDIPATRDYGGIDLSPAWIRWPLSSRVRLRIGSPRLSSHDTITVTAWHIAGYRDEVLTLPGILGASLRECPLPVEGAAASQRARWSDTAAHEIHSITVDAGVQLEVLDFGGEGSPIILLPGLGATAHAFDDLAPQLAKHHRVIALTRRGAGDSSRPDFGFDTARLSLDVLAVMDELALAKALLVGHSIAGEELTWLGGHHPERFSGLVYLDAAFDRTLDRGSPRQQRLRDLVRRAPPEPPLPPDAFRNYQSMITLIEQRGHHRYPEGELIAFLNADNPFVAGTPNIDRRSQQAIQAGLTAPDYSRVKIPALAVYAFAAADAPLPAWFDRRDASLAAEFAEARRLENEMKREHLERFRREVALGEVVEMANASHYLTLSNPQEVREFILKFATRMDTRH